MTTPTRTLATAMIALALVASCGSDDSADDAANDASPSATETDTTIDTDPDTASDGGPGDDSAVTSDESAADDADTAAASDDSAADGDDTADDDRANAAGTDLAEGAGRATLVIDGMTYEYATVAPGPDDDWYQFCTSMAGSLQGTMQQVDDAGNVVADGNFIGEVSFILLEPGGAYEATGDPAELQISFADGGYLAHEDGLAFDAPADGTIGSGTVTVAGNSIGSDGQMQTDEHEVSIDVAC